MNFTHIQQGDFSEKDMVRAQSEIHCFEHNLDIAQEQMQAKNYTEAKMKLVDAIRSLDNLENYRLSKIAMDRAVMMLGQMDPQHMLNVMIRNTKGYE
ncbi:hypothetical protein [Terribacillus saccharophilus]|uniref:hypothetical protein n=1 Tax=Terribacillus saccharophilus TaxID=361277 RepID=UPI000BA6BA17|nr:hypothetical protein [Terribacillus saccharophilus]PAF19714.1 hypothetical protein CHH51_01230 [Terribacillus saccharophilus]